MQYTFLVGKFESNGKQRWCLALRDGRQQNREEIILIDPGKEATEWMKTENWTSAEICGKSERDMASD